MGASAAMSSLEMFDAARPVIASLQHMHDVHAKAASRERTRAEFAEVHASLLTALLVEALPHLPDGTLRDRVAAAVAT